MCLPLDDLRPLLEPQERFDQLVRSTLRRFGPKAVDLSYANVRGGPEPEVRRALQLAAAEHGELCFQYTPYGGRATTRRAIASKLSAASGLSFTLHDVVMTPGAMAALNVAFRALVAPGHEVIVPVPCWHDYPLYLKNLGFVVRPVALGGEKHLDLSAIEQALSERTGAILLSQPCCPTGVLYSKAEIDALSALLRDAEHTFDSRIFMISDEVHRELIWRGDPFHSPLSSYGRSVSIYSFGKALALQGQRTGYVAISPEMPDRDRIRQSIESCVRLMGFCTPTELMQRVVLRLLDYRPPLATLAATQALVRSALHQYGYAVCDAGATFFVYVRSPIDDDVAFVERLAAHGVLAAPSSLFHEPRHFRLSLTARPDDIVRGLPAFAAVLEKAVA